MVKVRTDAEILGLVRLLNNYAENASTLKLLHHEQEANEVEERAYFLIDDISEDDNAFKSEARAIYEEFVKCYEGRK